MLLMSYVPHLAGFASTSAHTILHRHTYIGKGWGTGVPHLAGFASTSAHIILHRHTYIGKGWGTGVPHLAYSTK